MTILVTWSRILVRLYLTWTITQTKHMLCFIRHVIRKSNKKFNIMTNKNVIHFQWKKCISQVRGLLSCLGSSSLFSVHTTDIYLCPLNEWIIQGNQMKSCEMLSGWWRVVARDLSMSICCFVSHQDQSQQHHCFYE